MSDGSKGAREEEPADRTCTEELAGRIADRVFVSVWDREARNQLERLLIEFAAEIKRSAIEP